MLLRGPPDEQPSSDESEVVEQDETNAPAGNYWSLLWHHNGRDLHNRETFPDPMRKPENVRGIGGGKR